MSPKGYPINDWIINLLLIFVSLLAIVLNSMILHILHRKQLYSTTFKLIANQTVAEILCSVLVISNNWFCWSYLVNASPVLAALCQLLGTIRESTLYVSNFSMLVIAYERYRKLYRHLRSDININVCIVFTWILSIGLWAVRSINSQDNIIMYGPKFMFSCKVILRSDIDFFVRGYHRVIISTFANIVPLFVIAFFYYKVITKVRRRRLIGSIISKDRLSKLDQNNRRTTEMLITLIACYFLITIPYYVLILTQYVLNQYNAHNDCNEDMMIMTEVFALSTFFYCGSLVINPFIIFVYNPDFKREARHMFRWKRWSETTVRLQTPSATSE